MISEGEGFGGGGWLGEGDNGVMKKCDSVSNDGGGRGSETAD